VNFDYHRYLAGREWAVLKRQVRQRSGGGCERCHAAPASQVQRPTSRALIEDAIADVFGRRFGLTVTIIGGGAGVTSCDTAGTTRNP
jgi:hypothetical protein